MADALNDDNGLAAQTNPKLRAIRYTAGAEVAARLFIHDLALLRSVVHHARPEDLASLDVEIRRVDAAINRLKADRIRSGV